MVGHARPGPHRRKDARGDTIRLAQAITRELSEFTEEGSFYRVDLRLRPEGGAGNIAASLNACKNYYLSWGETFERMALIKDYGADFYHGAPSTRKMAFVRMDKGWKPAQ